MRLPALALVALLLGGCAHQVRRSALVPAVVPPMRSGTVDNDRLVSLSLGNSTFLRASTPVEVAGGDRSAGLYLPRTQFDLEAMFVVANNFHLGPKVEIGLYQGATPIARDIPPPPEEPVVGFGPSLEYSLPIGSRFRIGLGAELLLTFAPYATYTGCPSACRQIDSSVDSTAVLGLWAIPSVRVGPVSLFAGIAARNQPTNIKDDVVYYGGDYFDEDAVTFGKIYGVVLGGLQLHLGRILDIGVEIYYPFNQSPIAYGGPALSAWLTVPLGPGPAERRRRRAQQPLYPPGYSPYPPPGYPAPGYPPPGYVPPGYPAPPPAPAPAPRRPPASAPAPPGPPPVDIQ